MEKMKEHSKWSKNISKEQIATAALLILCFFYLFMQHRLVGMYYDDFGNASLSYGYDSSAVHGTDYSISDLLAWAKYIYLNWGGRIIYALMMIPLLKSGAHLFMFIQVLVIMLIIMAMLVIARKYTANANNALIVSCFILGYGLLRGEILTMGVYWASASVLYVWPLLPFFLSIIIYYRLEEKNTEAKWYDYLGIVVMVPLVTLSQEQIGGAFIVWLIFHILLSHWKNEKKYLTLDIPLLLYSLVTFGIFFAAPGNWARLETNEAYADMSMVERILDSLPKVFSLFCDPSIKYFNFYLLLVGFIVMIRIAKDTPKWYVMLSSIGLLPFLIIDVTDILARKVFAEEIRRAAFGIFLVDMFFLLLFYFVKRGQLRFMALMIAAVASVFCLILSPAFSMRSCIPYVFICFVLCAVVISDGILEISQAILFYGIRGIMGIMALAAGVNIWQIYGGYESNYYMDNYNFNELKNYNQKDDTIYLLEYDNNIYRAQMSCDDGFENIDYWIKEYFDIPKNIQIEWKTQKDLFRYAAQMKLDLTFGEGFYEDEGGYRWADKEAELVLLNTGDEDLEALFSCEISLGSEQEADLEIICNNQLVYQGKIDHEGNNLEITLKLSPGENCVKFITDGEAVPQNIDERTLVMHFSNINCEIDT